MFSIDFDIEQEILVEASVSDVFSIVSDFNQWPLWSPWLIQEPDAVHSVSQLPLSVGHTQSWQGARIGKGEMNLREFKKDSYISCDLTFFSPWKSHSKIQFYFEPINCGNGCKVRWSMQGKLPFFMFFVKKQMTAFVAHDYLRGLKMLKEYSETGSVCSHVDIKGVASRPGFYYLGVEIYCDIDELENNASAAFERLQKSPFQKPDMVLSLVNDFDLVNQECSLIMAFAYSSKPTQALPIGFVEGYVPPHRAQEVIHTGSYRHLANGWATLINYARYKKLRLNKQVREYEVYLNSPSEVAEDQLRTAIYIPVK